MGAALGPGGPLGQGKGDTFICAGGNYFPTASLFSVSDLGVEAHLLSKGDG